MIIETKTDWLIGLNASLDAICEEIIPRVYFNKAEEVKQQLLEAVCKQDALAAADILENIWSDAPDKSYIHTWRGWHNLCDLCSESWILIEEK